MKAEVKYFHSPDIDDLKSFKPKEENSFGFHLQIIVGEKGKKGNESFDMEVCTPDWLRQNFDQNEVIFGRYFLIVFKYNYELISQKIIDYVNNLDEDTWSKLAEKIGRLGRWEFEDYREF